MTTDEISRLAKAGSLPEDRELSCPERCLYHTLKNLYDQFREKKITAEQGDKEKKAALMQFQRDIFEYQRDKELIQHHASLWREIELTGRNPRKHKAVVLHLPVGTHDSEHNTDSEFLSETDQ